MQPISVVQGKGFLHMAASFEACYQVSHRKIFTESEIHHKTKARVEAVTNSYESIALTTDCLSNRANQSYLGL